MLKRRLCEAVFQWELRCDGPFLIADGRYSQKEVMKPYENNREEKKRRGGWYPDKFFINREEPEKMIGRIRDSQSSPPNGKWGFYVPGTSIRGPFRALAERIIRSLLPEDAPPHLTACNPFEQKNKKDIGCSKRLEKEENNGSKYATACSACKLFGCAGLASRISFTDAGIIGNYKSVYRDMIGIDRFTGGVFKGDDGSGGANMRYHVLENTKFTTTVTVVNFELWQLGLLAYIFRDFKQGLVPIGFGKTKGFGQVKGEITEIILTYPVIPTQIEHMGSLMSSATERDHYGIHICESPSFEEYFDSRDDGLSLYHSVAVTNITAFWDKVAPLFNEHVSDLRHRTKEYEHQAKEKVT